MNNDIVPRRSSSRPSVAVPPRPAQQPVGQDSTYPTVAPVSDSVTTSIAERQSATPAGNTPVEAADTSPKLPRPKYMKWIFISIAVIILMCVGFIAWYQFLLRPVATGDVPRVIVEIKSGSSPSQIATLLDEKNVIRSARAFEIYTRLNDSRNKLQAGTFSLSPAESTGQIVGHLMAGSSEEFEVTFYPGATLNLPISSNDSTPSHRQVLQKLGFSDAEITEAFDASYANEYPVLFADKPPSADLEGYIYGETYRVASGSTVKQILMRTFDEFESKIKSENIVGLYKEHGFTLYEGITLASIVQREVLSSSGKTPSA
ncbi:MAG: endolytic transglycosylase MltG, partial [Candidatus Saccharimonadales bacterium]